MVSLRLILFESRKQIASFTFIMILGIFTVFAVSQLDEIFHMPVMSEQDIHDLNQSGERDYIFIKSTDVELKANTLNFIKNRIADGTIQTVMASQFDVTLSMLDNNKYSFNNVFDAMKGNENISPWLNASKVQYSQRLGTVEEVNDNIRNSLGNKGYSPILYKKYVTYMQLIASFLIFPIFLLMYTRDYRDHMYEIVYAQAMSPSKYILCRYLGTLIPLLLYMYLLGIILNFISISRFVGMGLDYEYTVFLNYFLIYLLPTVVFLSALITLLMVLINKTIAILPIYAIYIIFNVTPSAFRQHEFLGVLINPILRLDEQNINIQAVLINRLIYISLAMVFMLMTCKRYKHLRRDLRKVITI